MIRVATGIFLFVTTVYHTTVTVNGLFAEHIILLVFKLPVNKRKLNRHQTVKSYT